MRSSNGSAVSQWKRSPPPPPPPPTPPAAAPRQAVTQQSELAHRPGPRRRPLLRLCTVIHLLVTLFPHNWLERPADGRQCVGKRGREGEKNGNCSCCEFQSVTSAVCIPRLPASVRGVCCCSSEWPFTLRVDKLRSRK